MCFENNFSDFIFISNLPMITHKCQFLFEVQVQLYTVHITPSACKKQLVKVI